MELKKGNRFYHKHWLDTEKWDGKSPQLFEITKVTRFQVWYKPVYTYRDGDNTREELGHGFVSSHDYFMQNAMGSAYN